MAQSKDTVLNMVLTKPYFYNLVQGQEGAIYAGTSEGIVQIEDVNLRHYGSLKGYVTTNADGKPIIDSGGIRYYKENKYKHLLPYPEIDREEYHAQKGNLFYICSGGKLYIFDLVAYEYSYPEHSIRSISKNLVGTYSGIYLNGKKLAHPAPDYTDGYIREFNGRAFICNYGLYVLERDAVQSGNLIQSVNFISYNTPGATFINDIFPSPDGRNYYLATENALLRTDYNFKKDTTLYAHNYKDIPITLITEDLNYLYFTSREELFDLNYKTGKIRSVLKLDKPILNGVYLEFQKYLLTENALYRFNSGQQLEKLANLEKAHTMVKISGSELLISTDLGLFHFNIASRTLSPVIKDVEFNRRALYKDNDAVFAGSINGLYKIQISDIPLLIEGNKAHLEKTGNITSMLLIGALVMVLFIILIIILQRFRKRLKAATETIESLKSPKESVTRERIEAYIQDHLSVASIKTLMDEFQLNAPQIYIILKPDRPGTLIQQIRLATVKKMRAKGQSYDEIAAATGLSISYLKKLKT
ncbi:MAG: hypothetical protein ACO29O_06420 [Chitinophagaceae bacterium]